MRWLALLIMAASLRAETPPLDDRPHPTLDEIQKKCEDVTPVAAGGMEAFAPAINVKLKPGFKLVAVEFRYDNKVVIFDENAPADVPLIILDNDYYYVAIEQLDMTKELGHIDDILAPECIEGKDNAPQMAIPGIRSQSTYEETK